jgi:hypothetical protein
MMSGVLGVSQRKDVQIEALAFELQHLVENERFRELRKGFEQVTDNGFLGSHRGAGEEGIGNREEGIGDRE